MACHSVLLEVIPAIMQRRLFYLLKCFRVPKEAQCPAHARRRPEHYLSAPVTRRTTCAGKVQKALAKVRTSGGEEWLVWRLDHGVAYYGSSFLIEAECAKSYDNEHKILPRRSLHESSR